MAKKELGTNVKVEVNKANKLLIEIDLTKTHGKSKSGKTITIGSTQGNQKLYDAKNKPFTLGLNCYKYPED